MLCCCWRECSSSAFRNVNNNGNANSNNATNSNFVCAGSYQVRPSNLNWRKQCSRIEGGYDHPG